jgi:threonine/homoserine/homoserine lactone efflux protein
MVLTGIARARVKANERWRRWRETLVGTMFIALGIRLAFIQKQ